MQQKLSQEFQEKLQEWERNKSAVPGSSVPSTADETQDPAFLKKMEEWQKIKSQSSVRQHPTIQLQSEENLPPEFRKKLQEWQKMKKSPGKEETTKKKLGEWPKWKSVSGHNRSEEAHFEYPQLSEEFIKKLETWKQIKASGSTGCDDSESRKSAKDNKTPSPRLIRKSSPAKQSRKGKESQDKELQWFEKELGKIEKEKQRLERERQKFLEREER